MKHITLIFCFLLSISIGLQAQTITQTTKTTNLPPRIGFKMIEFNGEYWFMGGENTKEGSAQNPKPFYNDIWKSSDGETWSQVTNNADWSKRSYFNLLKFDNKLWIIGGIDPSSELSQNVVLLNDVWSSTDGINWTKITDQGPWENRGQPFATSQNGKMYLIGGHTHTAWTLHQDIWETSNGTNWSEVGSISDDTLGAVEPRNGIWKQSVIEFNNEYFMFGGSMSSQGVGFTSVLKSTDMLNWTVVTRNTPWKDETYNKIEYLSPFVYQNTLYVVVDTKEYSGESKLLLFSSTDGATWNEVLELPTFVTSTVPALGFMIRPQTLNVGDKVNIYGSFYSSIVNPETDTELHLVQLSSSALGVNDVELNHIKIFPNPVSTELFVETLQNNSPYTLTNFLGQVVKKGSLSSNQSIVVSDLENGVYFLTVETKEVSKTIKFIKK